MVVLQRQITLREATGWGDRVVGWIDSSPRARYAQVAVEAMKDYVSFSRAIPQVSPV